MNSLSAIFALLSVLLFAAIVESRVGPGGYEKIIIEKHLVPKDLWKLVKQKFELNNVDSLSGDKAEKADCHENEKPKFEFEITEFEPRPNASKPSIYHDDSEVTGSRTLEDEPGFKAIGNPKAEKHAFDDDFEPRPDATFYND